MPSNLIDDEATLVQVMTWCRQATRHYLGQCWPRSMSPTGVTRPQCVNVVCCFKPTWNKAYLILSYLIEICDICDIYGDISWRYSWGLVWHSTFIHGHRSPTVLWCMWYMSFCTFWLVRNLVCWAVTQARPNSHSHHVILPMTPVTFWAQFEKALWKIVRPNKL